MKGFTLVELLIVISVVAILASISLVVFSGVQKGARDSVRRTDLTQIAKMLEGAKDRSTGIYTYYYCDAQRDFPNYGSSGGNVPLPEDPRQTRPITSGVPRYCIRAISTTTPRSPPSNNWSGQYCSSGFTVLANVIGGSSSCGTNPLGIFNTSPTRSWTLCAISETSATPICVSSQTR